MNAGSPYIPTFYINKFSILLLAALIFCPSVGAVMKPLVQDAASDAQLDSASIRYMPGVVIFNVVINLNKARMYRGSPILSLKNVVELSCEKNEYRINRSLGSDSRDSKGNFKDLDSNEIGVWKAAQQEPYIESARRMLCNSSTPRPAATLPPALVIESRVETLNEKNETVTKPGPTVVMDGWENAFDCNDPAYASVEKDSGPTIFTSDGKALHLCVKKEDAPKRAAAFAEIYRRQAEEIAAREQKVKDEKAAAIRAAEMAAGHNATCLSPMECYFPVDDGGDGSKCLMVSNIKKCTHADAETLRIRAAYAASHPNGAPKGPSMSCSATPQGISCIPIPPPLHPTPLRGLSNGSRSTGYWPALDC